MSAKKVIIVNENEVRVVTVGIAGPAGPSAYQIAVQEGFNGTRYEWLESLKNGGSAGAVRYIHTQGSASAEWTVNHNLGEKPIAEVIDSGGSVVEAEIRHISANQLKIYFSAAQSGQVRCL